MLEWAKDGGELHVPSLWGWEVLNAVGMAVKRRRITADHGKEFLEQLKALNVKIDESLQVQDLPRLNELAAKNRLTSYDATYLDLAMRLSLPLATLDTDLERAARAESIEVLGKSPLK